MSDIKIGDIVTVDLGENNDSSNTYLVNTILEDRVLLEHPWVSGVFIIKPKEELNRVQATIKNSFERCLDFCIKNKNNLDYKTKASLDALTLYFCVYKRLSSKQKQELASICGVIANIELNQDIGLAAKTVKNNQGILDHHNRIWYTTIEHLFVDPSKVTSKKQAESILNMAGFVLAQLHTK